MQKIKRFLERWPFLFRMVQIIFLFFYHIFLKFQRFREYLNRNKLGHLWATRHCREGSDWVKGGIGDLDLHVRWRRFWDHALKIKSIDLNIQSGLLVPVGTKSDKYYPSSVPFMGNGHWGIYFDAISEFELKQNWK